MEKVSNICNFGVKNAELSDRITVLEAELSRLKQQINQTPVIIIEKLYVRRVDVDQLRFNLDKIAVDDLSGMLNVGINSDGKMKNEKTEKK